MMKKSIKSLIVITTILSFSLCVYFFVLFRKRNSRQKLAYSEVLGSYTLDLKKTDLGSYLKDSATYRRLTVTFTEDSQFHFNMKVPFILDSSGRWLFGGIGLEDWNVLQYQTWLTLPGGPPSGDQFTNPWTPDSLLYINSVTPQAGYQSVNILYFKKVKR